MKLSRFILSAAFVAATAAIPASVDLAGGPAQPDPASPATQPAADPLAQAIRQAPDPSATVDAYARGIAAKPDSIDIRKAYVDRMVAFNLPEMAQTQARDLNTSAPNDGLAWAVTAYVSGRHGDISAAIFQISVAEQKAPTNPFVLQTAGQLSAWYVVHADPSTISPSVQQSADAIRRDLQNNPIFTQAYAQAMQAYSPPAQAANTVGTPDTQPAPSVATYLGNPVYNGEELNDQTYTPPPVVYENPSYPYDNPGYWDSWWPYYPSVIVVPRGGNNFQRFHHQGNFTGQGFNRGGAESRGRR